MVRFKITTQDELTLKTPMSYLEKGKIMPLKILCGKCEKYIIENDGECFVVISPSGEFAKEGIMFPIIGRIDDYEGAEFPIEELQK